jgi:hypothetical protein
MTRNTILAGAVALASLMAGSAMAQPADPNYQAQQQDYQAKQQQYQNQLQAHDAAQQAYSDKQQAYDAQKDAYARQRAGYRASRDTYDEQRALYLLGRIQYEAKYGKGSYDTYTRTHTTTTVVGPAGNVESRTKTTVIEKTRP